MKDFEDPIKEDVPLEVVMDRERLAHAKLEAQINEKIDAEIRRYIDHPILGLEMKPPFISRPSNPSLFFIIPNELAERFCYYGFSPLMKNLLGKGLGLNKYTYGADGALTGEVDTTVVNTYRLYFDVATYMTPLIGAFISDSFLDKYKTIMSLGLFYMIGMYLISFATNPSIFGFSTVFAPILEASPAVGVDPSIKYLAPPNVSSTPAWAIYTALALISFGTGGIKPCVSAHGGDQFIEGQTLQLNQFYSFFYMAINVGALASSYVTPKIKANNCFGSKSDCYSYAFLVCAVTFTFAYILFGIGKRYYRVVPPAGRFVIKDIFSAWIAKLSNGVEYAEQKYGKSLLVEAADLGKVLLAILPTPIFWMGFNQNSNTWQDSTDRMGDSFLNSEQVNALVNPLLIVILAPIFSSYIYPRVPKSFGLLQRICVGYLFAGISFILCALIEAYVNSKCTIDTSLPKDDPFFGKCTYLALNNLIYVVPYFFLTVGEVLVSISGLNFVYQEVGKRTKSSSTALWLLTSSIGSLITSQLIKALSPALEVGPGHPVTYVQFYYICAGILFAAIIPQGIIAYFYTYKVDREDARVA